MSVIFTVCGRQMASFHYMVPARLGRRAPYCLTCEASVVGRHRNATGNCRGLMRHTHRTWKVSNLVSKEAEGSKKPPLAKLFKNGGFVQDAPVCL